MADDTQPTTTDDQTSLDQPAPEPIDSSTPPASPDLPAEEPKPSEPEPEPEQPTDETTDEAKTTDKKVTTEETTPAEPAPEPEPTQDEPTPEKGAEKIKEPESPLPKEEKPTEHHDDSTSESHDEPKQEEPEPTITFNHLDSPNPNPESSVSSDSSSSSLSLETQLKEKLTEELNFRRLKANAARRDRRGSNLEEITKLASRTGSFANQSVRDLLHISQSTASYYLASLVKSGKLKKEGKGKGKATIYHS